MKLIILGANGMLGSMLSFVCRKQGYPALRVTRSMFDALKDPVTKLDKYFDAPCCVINCIGAIPQKKYSDQDYKILNTKLPLELSKLCELKHAPFIHVSTNCVFSGKISDCDENSTPDATDSYGLSKFNGEPMYGMILRCSIIGPERCSKAGLMEWFLQNDETSVNGFTNHYWNGLTTYELSNVIIQCVSNNCVSNGIFHLHSEKTVSKYELLCQLKMIFKKSITIVPKETDDTKYYTLKSINTMPQKTIDKQLEDMVRIYNEFKAPLKILFFNPGHVKNTTGLELMCTSCGLLLEQTRDRNIVYKGDYDILISNDSYFDPESLPTHIKVVFGPQFFVFPSGPLCGPYESKYEHNVVYNSLSKWVQNAFDEFASLKVPIVQFPFAVDISSFTINKSVIYDCLLYIKHRNKVVIERVVEYLMSKGLKFKVIEYGKYNESEYKEKLCGCKFMIVIDAHESQGFALLEAMSCNVPLLVLDAKSMHDEVDSRDLETHIYKQHRDKMLKATSVPYWSDECGLRFNSLEDFPNYLNKMCDTYSEYTPRNFVTSHLSPIKCMNKILHYFDFKQCSAKL